MSSLVEVILNWSQLRIFVENCVDGNVVERVNVYNLLRVIIDDTLKWKSHVNSVCAKASTPFLLLLYFLKILKRSSLSNGALVCLSSDP